MTKCKKTSLRPLGTKKRTVKKSTTPKGLQGLAKSFIGVGIPQVVETQLVPERKGMSNYLVHQGNILARSAEDSIKIKL